MSDRVTQQLQSSLTQEEINKVLNEVFTTFCVTAPRRPITQAEAVLLIADITFALLRQAVSAYPPETVVPLKDLVEVNFPDILSQIHGYHLLDQMSAETGKVN